MKPLVVYYSKTGNTKKLGQLIAEQVSADVEALKDLKNRKGIISWFLSGMDGMRGKTTKLAETTKSLADYDTVFIGTPVWGWNLVPATRTYLVNNGSALSGKKVYLFCTMSGSGDKKTFESMKELLKSAEVKGMLAITAKQLNNEDSIKIKLSEFVK